MNHEPLTFDFDEDFGLVENGDARPEYGFEMPRLSVYNEAAEGFRLQRLASAWGGACATVNLLSNRYQRRWSGAIAVLNDHKGTLEVTWRDEQSRVMFEGVVMGAWERECEHCGAHALAEEDGRPTAMIMAGADKA